MVFYASADKLQNITKDGNLVTLSFQVSSDASYEDYPVTVEITQVIDAEGNNVKVTAVNGKVTVQESNSEMVKVRVSVLLIQEYRQMTQ